MEQTKVRAYDLRIRAPEAIDAVGIADDRVAEPEGSAKYIIET